MQTNSKKRRLLKALVVLTLCFIWGNSLMPATVSGAISGQIKDLINMLLGDVGSQTVLSGEGLLRKLAHACEFAALGLLLTLLVEEGLKAKVSLLVLCGLGAALIDETLQLFVDGRSGQIKDVWIDLAGFGIGVAIVSLMRYNVNCIKKRRLRLAHEPKP